MHNNNNLPIKHSSHIQKQIILENPFHPLDLSAHDLLTVYKKFDVSRQANRNPKHQLPIQTIAQLISSLKGCKPSYVQKCMSQALIKDSISWNQFLTFLDQQSEVRYKILDWLVHEKAIIKFRFEHQLPFRNKIMNYYDYITDINFILLGQQKIMLASVDNKKLVLVDITDGKFHLIDEMTHKNKKQVSDSVQAQIPNESQTNNKFQLNRSALGKKQKNDLKDKGGPLNNKSMIKSQRNLTSCEIQGILSQSTSPKLMDEQTYLRRERKNIHAAFSLFNEVPLQQSRKIAEFATDKIENRVISVAHINYLKDAYEDMITQKKTDLKPLLKQQEKPIDIAKKKLQSLYQQKATLSYNPYKSYRISKLGNDYQQMSMTTNPKKLNYDRKQKEYLLQSSHQKYCSQLNCIGIIYYNMELCLIKVAKQYNKIILEEQDSLKVALEKDYKKNQIIEMLEFYYHRTTGKWFILVLFRNQYKNQSKSLNDSFIKGYEIIPSDAKRKGDKKYYFLTKKQEFIIDLGRNEIIKILSQQEYGLHLITHNGKYFTWKEDYVTMEKQTIYWKKDFQQKFKGAALSFSCLCVSSYLNKTLLGTIKGTIIIYDLFSRQYKLDKVCNCTILQIQVLQEQAYILGQNQKLIIYDILRAEQTQVLNVKNQQKLHEKVDKFVLSDDKIICYGTCIRVFQKFIDETLQQQKFKMENTYTWRLNKLDKSKGIQNPALKVIPTFRKEKTNAEYLVKADNLFIVLTQIQQAIFYAADSMQVKFTIVLDIPHDEKVMKISVSKDEKLLGILLYTQAIYVYNVFTQQLILHLKSTPYNKFTSISFLDKKNQYFMAAGTETGKIILLSLHHSPQKQTKTMQFHSKAISMTTLANQLLISASENQQLAIWQLPFNILRHQIKLNQKISSSDYITDKLGFHLDTGFFRTAQGTIIQINTAKGQIKSVVSQFKKFSYIAIDVVMGYLFGVQQPGSISLFEKTNEKEQWKFKKKILIDQKHHIIGIGIIYSEKAAFFAKNGVYVWAYKNDRVSKFKSFLESIQ